MEASDSESLLAMATLALQKRLAALRSDGAGDQDYKKVEKRMRVMVLYSDAGFTQSQIMKTTGYNISFVKRWIAAAKEGREATDLARKGRPKKVSQTVRKKIVRRVKGKGRASTRKVATELSSEGIDLSRETIRGVLHIGSYRPGSRKNRF
jgi:transposase